MTRQLTFRALTILVFLSVHLFAESCKPETGDLAVRDQSVTLYPALVPAHRLHIISNDPVRFPLGSASATDFMISVNAKRIDPGIVRVVYDRSGGAVVDNSLELELVGPYFKSDDKVTVELALNSERATGSGCGSNNSRQTLTLTPSFIQSEALRNKLKRPVGELSVVFDELSLTHRGFRTHLATDSAISTDAKDNSSNVNLLFGAERSLLSSWFLPWHLDTKLTGDQVVDNLSWVSSTGLTTNLPWAWTRAVLNNPVLDAPVSPEFTFEAQHERRIRQDAASRNRFLDKDAFRLHGAGSWTPLRVLRGDGTGSFVSMEIKGEGWYLPRQLTSRNIRKDILEGAFSASVLVPVGPLTASGTGLTGSGAKTQIRIQYAVGANEANGFQHYSKLSIGVEATK